MLSTNDNDATSAVTPCLTSYAASATRWLLRVERHHLALARHIGCSVNELVTLLHLIDAGPMTISELASLLRVRPGVMSTLVDRLNSKGFVDRRSHSSDRRQKIVVLSGERAALAVRAARLAADAMNEEWREDVAADVAETFHLFSVRLDSATHRLLNAHRSATRTKNQRLR